MKRSACLVVLSVAALVGALLPGPSGAAPSIPPTVVHIADGDTIDVSTDHETRVRFLNVNTPEIGSCLADQATAYTTSLAPLASIVELSYDVERTDQYGRTLAWVRNADGTALSVALARQGLGVPMLVEPNHAHYGDVVAATNRARRDRVGVFDPTVVCTFAHDLESARATAQQARAMPVRTRAQYRRALATLDHALTAARATKVGRYGLEGRWIRDYLSGAKKAIRASAHRIRDLKDRQRRHAVASQHPPVSHGGNDDDSGSSSGGPPGYTGPRCYEPGGVVWHPCS